MVPDDRTAGPRFARFCESYIVQTKGRWGGRSLALEDWQREFWWEALEVDPTTGLRIYSEVGLGIPRKNGKSTQASAIGHYLLVADGENEPEVYIAAAAKDQARIVFGQQRSMALRSPRLLDHEVVLRSLIECRRNGGIMRAVSSDAALQFGFNPHGNVVDELHAHRSGDLYTALTSGGGAREQPLTVWISTAGGGPDGILAQVIRQMVDGAGELEDRGALRIYRDRANGVLIWFFAAPRNADIEDPEVWRACNPASWLQDGSYLRKEYGRMQARGALMEWRTFHLNQFPDSEEAWLPAGAWAGCRDDVAMRPDLPIGIGVHRSHSGDAGCVVWAQRQPERLVIGQKLFSAEAATGHVSTEAMRATIRDLARQFPLAAVRDPKTGWPIRGPAVAFDRMGFQESAEMLDADGLNLVDFPQGAAHMGPATAIAHEAILTRRLAHDGQTQMAEQVGATVARLTDRGTVVVPNRRPGTRPNHGAVAMVMAVAMAHQETPTAAKPKRPTAVGF